MWKREDEDLSLTQVTYWELVSFLPRTKFKRSLTPRSSQTTRPKNNRVERLKGTLRERVSVQRGWKNPDSKIAEDRRIHCDFMRPEWH